MHYKYSQEFLEYYDILCMNDGDDLCIWLTISAETSTDRFILMMTFFSLNDFVTRFVILYQTCVACKAWVTDLQVLQEWQKVPPEDTASLWTINLSIKIWRMEGWWIIITWCIFLFLSSQEYPAAVLVQTSWGTGPTPAGGRSCLQMIKT